MKKIILATMIAASAIGGTIGYFCQQSHDKCSALALANIEALSNNETNPLIKKCETYCKLRPGYICILQTNKGFTINCDEMVPWNYIGI